MYSEVSKELYNRLIDFVLETTEGAADSFYVDDIVELKKHYKVVFFIRPADFNFKKSLGIDYVIIPGPFLYDYKTDRFEISNGYLFAVTYGEDEEWLKYMESLPKEPIITYNDILDFLDKRGYLTMDDFEKVFEATGNRVAFGFQYTNREMKEGVLSYLPPEAITISEKFLKDVKAAYYIENSSIHFKIELPQSYSFYDNNTKTVIVRQTKKPSGRGLFVLYGIVILLLQ
ncbi:hypothetical protein ACLI1A_12160 [Flavobacterium sp. RHBU_3]|uniref:hypothetical protein n=1 Tax=Flavobacterium sp. RHBU_3 TaxID=3391184 RepID=UPI0039847A90